MEQHHRDLIRRNYRALAQEFSTTVDEVCLDLYQERIFNTAMKQDILAKDTSLRKAYKLLDLIEKRGPDAFDALYEACRRETLYKACDILKPLNAPHEPPVEHSDDEDELEADSIDFIHEEDKLWPSNSYIIDITYMNLKVLRVENRTVYDNHIDNPNFYQMTRKIRGQPFILYDKHSPLIMDRKGLEQLLRNLNFNDLKVKKVADRTALDELSIGDCDCLILFIMATDNEGFFSDSGGNGLKLVIDKLKNERSLAGKPKLIFHLTSKSEEKGKNEKNSQILDGAEEKKSRSSPCPDENTENSESSGNDLDIILKRTKRQPSQQEEEKPTGDRVDGPSSLAKYPRDSDILVIKSTDYGCEVIERETTETGVQKMTRFIHLIVDIFSKNANKMDFNDLLRLVNLRTGQTVANCRGSQRLKLNFFPGFHSVS